MRNKFLILCTLLLVTSWSVHADEGMWLLPYIEKLNIKDMKAAGFRLSAKDIYDVNNLAIKDAVVIFGGGCTGEVISPNGLVITNHHCGYGAIQQHSTVDHDYLKDGFWAMDQSEELPTPGLTVTFIRKMEDVTDRVLSGITSDMTETQRTETVKQMCDIISKEAVEPGSSKKAVVESFFGGNQYILFIKEVFEDIRMVGAPPSSIGKFGGDTDNWMWPRHTGDFSIFRIYSAPDGKPAKYSADNVPYKAPYHLPISLKGVKEGDFTFVLGFPGSTSRYMSSFEVDFVRNYENPIRIFVRGERQKILMEDMMRDEKIKIQYASKYAGSSNYWKNSIGMNKALDRLKVKEEKENIEKEFTAWTVADTSRFNKYGDALRLKEDAVKGRTPYLVPQLYISEALLRGTEIITPVRIMAKLINKDQTGIDSSQIASVKSSLSKFYKDYSPETDRKVSKKMFAILRDTLYKNDQPPVFSMIKDYYGGNVEAFVDDMFDNSMFSDSLKVAEFMKHPDVNIILSDPAYKMTRGVVDKYNSLGAEVVKYSDKYTEGHRKFISGYREMYKDKKMAPDANFTMRMTYGNVLPYIPKDGVIYNYYTTLSGVMEKEDPSNPYEFEVPEKLKELYEAKDFGSYGTDGDVRVNFISNNDITGGNSGSPVLNAKGELVGLAFDGNWEAMSGNIIFEPELQRMIAVDIRYVLFIIDKFAGDVRLLEEMTLVK